MAASLSLAFRPRLLLLVRPQPAPCKCAATQARLLFRARFSTSRLLQKIARPSRPAPKPAAKPAAPAGPKTAPARTAPAAVAGSATSQAARLPSTYAEQLAQRGRTLLYEAPSHFWFRAGCFSSATFCVSYTVYQYWTVILHPPEGLMWWVPHAFGLILVFMAGMGTYFVLGAGRIVRSIEAVPTAAAAKRIAAGGAAQTPPIYIEVATRRAVPFMPPKKMLFAPEEVQLPFRMYTLYAARNGADAAAGQRPLGLAERVRAERAAREARTAARKYAMDHILTAPFRDAAKAFGTAWAGIKRSFHREGFAKIKLGKEEYKLDVTGGWALDDGRAMDRLLPVRPNALR
ncbi:538bcd3d-707c-42df-9960-7c0248b12455 [Thermothielavioides terrestris]|uniref:538bcd3d-707c-42df-9960-7c0248b12455 n=1 Tax=Thermothielavioides terrestris TaxID=2587410 RepID=A0A446BII9_9PEZI|nr:538bcd3d-707c-42df-9960-7c0248b12455 [Thermothielavioides terrestris]